MPKPRQRKIEFVVRLNGTTTNPWVKLGLVGNPFPLIADSRFSNALRVVASLGENPISDADDIKKILKGFSEEFIKLCCENFKHGEMATFKTFFYI